MIGYLISSHIAYTAPLARLLKSMTAIPRSRIVVVVAGAELDYVTIERGMPIARHVTHNSFEYTALIDFAAHPNLYPAWSHVFLLHDTMEVGPDADYLIGQARRDKDAVAVWGGQCNLGLYRADYLRSCYPQLIGLKDCTKQEAVAAEGFLWRQLPDDRRTFYPGTLAESAPRAAYSGAARMQEYYAGVDIYKYKANWGQTANDAMVVVP